MPVSDFARLGYATLPAMVDAAALSRIDAALMASGPLMGARQMLQLDWCAALAEVLRGQLVVAGLLSASSARCSRNRWSTTGWWRRTRT